MKRLLLCLGLCLLLTGCTFRSRQSSEQFIPTGSLPEQTRPAVGPVSTDVVALPSQAGGAVKTVISEEGEYEYERTTIRYSYRLPFVDLSGGYALACNQEIETNFGDPIRDSLEAMEQFRKPVVQTVSYQADLVGPVLTLRIMRTDVDGDELPDEVYSVRYSLNATTGEKAVRADFLAAAGLTEERFLELLTQQTAVRFYQLTDAYQPTDPVCAAAYDQTIRSLSDPENLELYFTENGKLAVEITVTHPEGYLTREEVLLP